MSVKHYLSVSIGFRSKCQVLDEQLLLVFLSLIIVCVHLKCEFQIIFCSKDFRKVFHRWSSVLLVMYDCSLLTSVNFTVLI